MKFAEQAVEIDFARLLSGGRKGVAQRGGDALLVMGKVDTDHLALPSTVAVAVMRGKPGLVHGDFEIHGGITNGGQIGFVFS